MADLTTPHGHREGPAGGPARLSPPAETPDLAVRFHGVRKVFRGRSRTVVALDGVDLDIPRGGGFGVVGESGSGKTTLVRLALGLERPDAGTVDVLGRAVDARQPRELRWLRSAAQLVFQDPYGSLDPRMTIGRIVAEPLVGLRLGTAEEQRARVAEVLQSVGMPADTMGRYPHQFSGGQRQRIAIARALAPRPQVLFADEPVSALDVSIRAHILNVLEDIAAAGEVTLVLVSHDLDVVAHLCRSLAVMRAGALVEVGTTAQVYRSPQQAYTRELLDAALWRD